LKTLRFFKKFNIKIQTLIEKKFFSVCSVISVVKIIFISIGVYAFTVLNFFQNLIGIKHKDTKALRHKEIYRVPLDILKLEI